MPDNLPLHSCEMEEENSGVQPGSGGGLCGGTETSWQASCVRDKREMTFLLDLEPQTQQRDRAIWSTLPKDALFQSQPPGLSFSPPAFFSYALYLSVIAVNVTIPLKPFRGLHFLSFSHSFGKVSDIHCKSQSEYFLQKPLGWRNQRATLDTVLMGF